MDIVSLNFAKELFYDKCKYSLSNLEISAESKEYDACTFKLDGKKIIYRASKITPTKIGQFVTVWKRDKHDITCPFHAGDDFNFIIIHCQKDNLIGQFIFPKQVLLEKGIISSFKKEGKRGIRVYPPWDVTMNKQAQKTQQWQVQHFIELSLDKNQTQNIKQLLKILS